MNTLLRHRFVRHGLFWAAALSYSFLIQLPAYFTSGTELYLWGLLFNQLPASLLITYTFVYGVLPRLMRRRPGPGLLLLLGWLIGSVLTATVTHVFFTFVVQPGLFQQAPVKKFEWPFYFNYTWFVAVVTAGAAAAIKVTHEWYAQRQLSEQLHRRRLRSELQLLKAQLQPPFLFGTLRTLHTLTRDKSPDSPAAVLHLSALLRYMLYESQLDAVPLTDEVDMMRHYVALEKLRLGSNVEVSLNFSGSLDAHTIAPLLLLPFVENAFQHGTKPGTECPWISIDLVATRRSIIFKVINSQIGTKQSLRDGAGLRSVRQRLKHLYPDQHEFKVVAEPDTFLIVLHLTSAAAPGAYRSAAATPAPATAAPLTAKISPT